MDYSNKFEIFSLSNKGLKKRNNQDSTISDINRGIMIIADGTGEPPGGEVASSIAVSSIHHDLAKIPSRFSPKIPDWIEYAIIKANKRIFKTATQFSQCNGMGTTVLAVLLREHTMNIASAGHSRFYYYRNRRLDRITRDHSLAQELIDKGLHTPEEIKKNIPKNLLTRGLGLSPKIKVDVRQRDISRDDIYLMCSDGLTNILEDREICLTINRDSDNVERIGRSLINKAKDKGGMGDISVIVVKVM